MGGKDALQTSVCPGCGVVLPAGPKRVLPRTNSSWECWELYGEITGFELAHSEELGSLHQLTVDAYAAQHPDEAGTGIGIAYALAGLYLTIDRGWAGIDVRTAHQRMGKRRPHWPIFKAPPESSDITVLDVANAGVRAGSIEGHSKEIWRWAASVWDSWAAHHEAVAALAKTTLANHPPRPL